VSDTRPRHHQALSPWLLLQPPVWVAYLWWALLVASAIASMAGDPVTVCTVAQPCQPDAVFPMVVALVGIAAVAFWWAPVAALVAGLAYAALSVLFDPSIPGRYVAVAVGAAAEVYGSTPCGSVASPVASRTPGFTRAMTGLLMLSRSSDDATTMPHSARISKCLPRTTARYPGAVVATGHDVAGLGDAARMGESAIFTMPLTVPVLRVLEACRASAPPGHPRFGLALSLSGSRSRFGAGTGGGECLANGPLA